MLEQPCVGGEENVVSRSCEVPLLVSQRDLATGERSATEIAWMVMATSVVAVLACRLHELVKVLFQTLEAESTEYTRVPGVHTADEAVQELVRVSVSGRDLCSRWARRNVDEILRHVIYDARRILYLADVFDRGINLRLP